MRVRSGGNGTAGMRVRSGENGTEGDKSPADCKESVTLTWLNERYQSALVNPSKTRFSGRNYGQDHGRNRPMLTESLS